MFTLFAELIQPLLVRSSALAGPSLFRFHRLLLFLESGVGFLHVLVQRFGFRHQLQDAVFGLADFLFDVLNFVLEGLILLIGLSAQHLVPELGNLLLVGLDVAIQFFPVLLVRRERGFIGF